MLTDAPPLQLGASNDADSSTTVSRKPEVNRITIICVGKEIDLPRSIDIVRFLLSSTSMFQLRSRTFDIEMKIATSSLLFSTIVPIQFNTIT